MNSLLLRRAKSCPSWNQLHKSYWLLEVSNFSEWHTILQHQNHSCADMLHKRDLFWVLSFSVGHVNLSRIGDFWSCGNLGFSGSCSQLLQDLSSHDFGWSYCRYGGLFFLLGMGDHPSFPPRNVTLLLPFQLPTFPHPLFACVCIHPSAHPPTFKLLLTQAVL